MLESKSAAGATKTLQPGLLKPSTEAPLGTQSPKSRDIGVSEIDFSDISQATYAYRTNQVDDRLLRIENKLTSYLDNDQSSFNALSTSNRGLEVSSQLPDLPGSVSDELRVAVSRKESDHSLKLAQ